MGRGGPKDISKAKSKERVNEYVLDPTLRIVIWDCKHITTRQEFEENLGTAVTYVCRTVLPPVCHSTDSYV